MVSLCPAEDWPQFRGPNRDGISAETGLLKKWPKNGPRLIWETDGLGDGYASAAIADGLVYTTGMIDKKGYIFAFDLNGKPQWKFSYGPEWRRSYPATRCTPTIDGDRFYLMSGLGVVYCGDARTGEPIWSFDAFNEFKGVYPLWGMSENLLIDDDLLICSPGGQIASILALNKNTGKVVWACKELNQASTYCNPRAFTIGTNRVLVSMLRDSVVGLNMLTGKLLWRDDFDGYHTDRKRAVNVNAPIFHQGCIYTTSGYNNGGAMLQLNADGTQAHRIWTNDVLDNHHGGVMLIDGYIYGSNWHSNSRGNWACLRWQDGKVMYDERWNGNKGSMIYADGMLYCYDERTGDVALVPARPDKFKVTSSFRIEKGKGPFWAHPSIAHGRLYLRHGEYLMVYNIKKLID